MVNEKMISPVDGRYSGITLPFQDFFSEWALFKYRVIIEIEWLITMSRNDLIKELREFTPGELSFLRSIIDNFSDSDVEAIKKIEQKTNHDVKAVEYYIKERLDASTLADVKEFVHFGCTSEDINNLAYALILKKGIQEIWLPKAEELIALVSDAAKKYRNISMISHTHGQPATSTTMGKELAVFVYRWKRQIKQLKSLEYLGKFSGAVGNFNAQFLAYPEVDWQKLAKSFVESLGLAYNPLTTQIESHDFMAECFHLIERFNNITMDFTRDMWMYIALDYFKQHLAAGETGSSTMPHKINPINFETCEANLGMSNSILGHLAGKLQVSRLQRDLSDSSAQRNIGIGFAYSLIAIHYAITGFKKLSINKDKLEDDLNRSWQILAEAVQTLMRKHGYEKPYERLKELTRGKEVTKDTMVEFISKLKFPGADQKRIAGLTPQTYTGIAGNLVDNIDNI
ncbi:MAG: adenylosuccinate lyase [Firmicutes bacterium]|nr:adenylosuccinate lyase [Bacillota bacterium]